MKLIFLLISAFLGLATTDKCSDCLADGKHWCVTVNACGFTPCITTITKPLNCPELPDKAHAYDDGFIRDKVLITHSAAYNMDPQKCFDSKMPTMKVSKTVNVNCDRYGPKAMCFGFTAVDTVQKVIALTFRGTEGNVQLTEEILDFFHGKKPFFDAGNVFEYFYDAFLFQWNGGLQQDIRKLKYQYPSYELWVTGHSMGGAIASIAASYIVKSALYTADSIKLVTLGQPRTGDYDFAAWHDRTFPYSFRIVHHRDIAAHIPPQDGPDELFHHRTEVWQFYTAHMRVSRYNNNMTLGEPYHLCAEADGLYCSARQLDVSAEDHVWYFGRNFVEWGQAGCP
uniref:Lipase_3 domain-containing protein n=1 Tax=Caenorhabditis japonica TaxID=281687 RepID=A0A8R1EUC8_CAEJA